MTTNKMATSHSKHSQGNGSHPITDAESDDDHEAPECGIGNFKPALLQACANMPMFVGVYSMSALVSSTLTSYVNSQVTTLERHFGFSSAQTGLIMAANDIGFLVVILFVSFIAAKVHIPRALGGFTILFGVSGITCALPYFLFGAPSPTSLSGDVMGNISILTSAKPSGSFRGQLCDGVNHTSLNCDVFIPAAIPPEGEGGGPGGSRVQAGTALVVLVGGMVLQGVAKTPRSAFTTLYVDSNVAHVTTGFYMGIIIALAIMGPAIAFAVGGLFSRIYVTLEDTDLHYRHPKWIGAWWLGYITFGCAACVVALPLFLFPRRIKGGKQKTEPKSTETGNVNVPLRLTKFVKSFVEAIVRLVTNPVYVCTVLSSCCLLFAVGGSQSFTPKYIENQFDFPAWKANMAMAGVMLGTACLGTFVGGYLTKRLKMGPLSSLKFTMAMTSLSVLFTGLQMLFKCDQPYLYNSPGPRAAAEGRGVEGCGERCGCDDGDYFPVCAQDGRTFFSPCHAGCHHLTDSGNYVNCTCITGGVATAGMCDYSCVMFYPFIVCFCLATLLGTLAIIPKLIIYIRAVEERDKPLALGFTSFMTSITGWMLGPILFGKVIDGICIQWEESCEGAGACRLYDNDSFRLKLLGYQSVFRFLALVLVSSAYVFARKSKKFKASDKGSHKEDATKMMMMAGENEETQENFADPL